MSDDTLIEREKFAISQRIAACVSYNGQAYHGWQKLNNHLPTLQDFVERALSQVANHPVTTVCAGRTDAGVHALGQIIHFDAMSSRPIESWVFGTNRYLPADISIQWATPVDDSFHARFSAISRSYKYIIYNHVVRPAINNKGVSWYTRKLDESRMQEAAKYLIGEHDFNAYRTVHCQAKHAIRTIFHLDIKRQENLIIIDICANAFLHHMVRNIVGVLMKIGEGERKPIWAKEVLDSNDRKQGGVTAPPSGLYFSHVNYPKEFTLSMNQSSEILYFH